MRKRHVIPLILALLAAVGAPLPALAQSSYSIVRLRIGLVGEPHFQPADRRIEPFRNYLRDKLETPVEIVSFKDGQSLVDAAATHRLDYVIFSAATYAAAWRACGCFEPLVAPKSTDGTAGVRAILVVRNDSAFSKPADLAGKVLAAPDQKSVISRLVPVSELAAGEGLDLVSLVGRIETVRGPQAGVQLMLERKADAALAWSTLEGEQGEGFDRGTLHDLVARRQLDMHDIRIIWKSALIPNGPHAVRADLPLNLKNRLRDLMIDLLDADADVYDSVEPRFGGGFAPIGHSAYLPLLRLVTPLGQDPSQPPVKSIPTAPKP